MRGNVLILEMAVLLSEGKMESVADAKLATSPMGTNV